jgi:hypothetical protein
MVFVAGRHQAPLGRYYDIADAMLHVEQIALDRAEVRSFARLMRNLGYSCDRARYWSEAAWEAGTVCPGASTGEAVAPRAYRRLRGRVNIGTN